MSKFWETCEYACISFADGVRDGFRSRIDDRIAEQCAAERDINIETAAMAMLDAGLNDETVLNMLQKHWNLRRSEAEQFIEDAKMALRSHRLVAPAKSMRFQ